MKTINADTIIERVEEGVYDSREIIQVLIRWIGLGREDEFYEMLRINELLLEEDQ